MLSEKRCKLFKTYGSSNFILRTLLGHLGLLCFYIKMFLIKFYKLIQKKWHKILMGNDFVIVVKANFQDLRLT